MAKPLPIREVERQVRDLLQCGLPVEAVRERWEVLAKEWHFSGFAWLWGPALYRQDRIRYRPFILAHWGGFAQVGMLGRRGDVWAGPIGQDLDLWFQAVDRNDDIELFRRLLVAKHTSRRSWRPVSTVLVGMLEARLDAAPTPARIRIDLEKFDVWGLELTEAMALRLYHRNRNLAGPFILRHLPWTWSGDQTRVLWEEVRTAAMAAGDGAFADTLYQRQVPLKRWHRDALQACREIQDPAALCAHLERHHPQDLWRNLGDLFIELIEQRGRDVLPYVGRHLRQVWTPWLLQGSYGRLVALARDRGWWDLWSAVVRTCSRPQDFHAAVRGLLDDRALPEATVRERLLMLAGIGREANWSRLGIAQVQQLDDDTATAFHRRFPDLLRGPWKLHLQCSTWGPGLPTLIRRLLAEDDQVLIDFLASRMVTRGASGWGPVKADTTVEALADHFAALKAADDRAFGRRAIAVLGQIPAYAIHSYARLTQANRLARILFERSLAAFLVEPERLGDLVEAPEIHVQALAYRILGQDDPRARTAAVAHLDVLIGTLLRPLHRATRLAAFAALANATHQEPSARRILARAREALDLPDLKYPKEQLLGLIATVLHRQPGLRQACEQPVIHRHAGRRVAS